MKPVPQEPPPPDERVVDPGQPFVHLSAAPSTARSERGAETVAGELFDPICRRAKRLAQRFGGKHHQPSRVRVQGHQMSLMKHRLHNRRGIFAEISVEKKERGNGLLTRKHIEEP